MNGPIRIEHAKRDELYKIAAFLNACCKAAQKEGLSAVTKEHPYDPTGIPTTVSGYLDALCIENRDWDE